MVSLLVAILLLVLLVSLCYGKGDPFEHVEKEKDIIARLRTRYQEALKSGDQEKAFTYGRDYYCYLRNSRQLSAFDEQIIRNDLAGL